MTEALQVRNEARVTSLCLPLVAVTLLAQRCPLPCTCPLRYSSVSTPPPGLFIFTQYMSCNFTAIAFVIHATFFVSVLPDLTSYSSFWQLPYVRRRGLFLSQACKGLQGPLAHTLTPEACSSFLQVRAPWLARSAPRKVRALFHMPGV